MLSSEQEENVKDKQMGRILSTVNSGLIDPKQAKEAINSDNLLPTHIDENDDIFDNPQVDDQTSDTKEA